MAVGPVSFQLTPAQRCAENIALLHGLQAVLCADSQTDSANKNANANYDDDDSVVIYGSEDPRNCPRLIPAAAEETLVKSLAYLASVDVESDHVTAVAIDEVGTADSASSLQVLVAINKASPSKPQNNQNVLDTIVDAFRNIFAAMNGLTDANHKETHCVILENIVGLCRLKIKFRLGLNVDAGQKKKKPFVASQIQQVVDVFQKRSDEHPDREGQDKQLQNFIFHSRALVTKLRSLKLDNEDEGAERPSFSAQSSRRSSWHSSRRNSLSTPAALLPDERVHLRRAVWAIYLYVNEVEKIGGGLARIVNLLDDREMDPCSRDGLVRRLQELARFGRCSNLLLRHSRDAASGDQETAAWLRGIAVEPVMLTEEDFASLHTASSQDTLAQSGDELLQRCLARFGWDRATFDGRVQQIDKSSNTSRAKNTSQGSSSKGEGQKKAGKTGSPKPGNQKSNQNNVQESKSQAKNKNKSNSQGNSPKIVTKKGQPGNANSVQKSKKKKKKGKSKKANGQNNGQNNGPKTSQKTSQNSGQDSGQSSNDTDSNGSKQASPVQFSDSFKQTYKKALSRKAKIHAEIQIAYYLDKKETGSGHAHFIVSGKDTCYLCHAFLRSHGGFQVPQTHSQLYPSWRLPSLAKPCGCSTFDEALDQLNQSLEEDIRQALAKTTGSRSKGAANVIESPLYDMPPSTDSLAAETISPSSSRVTLSLVASTAPTSIMDVLQEVDEDEVEGDDDDDDMEEDEEEEEEDDDSEDSEDGDDEDDEDDEDDQGSHEDDAVFTSTPPLSAGVNGQTGRSGSEAAANVEEAQGHVFNDEDCENPYGGTCNDSGESGTESDSDESVATIRPSQAGRSLSPLIPASGHGQKEAEEASTHNSHDPSEAVFHKHHSHHHVFDTDQIELFIEFESSDGAGKGDNGKGKQPAQPPIQSVRLRRLTPDDALAARETARVRPDKASLFALTSLVAGEDIPIHLGGTHEHAVYLRGNGPDVFRVLFH